jgi:hypothetical protein
MANSYNVDFIVNRPASEVFSFLYSQKVIADMVYKAHTPDPQLVTYEVPNTAVRYGQQILVHVYDNDENTSIVKILSRNTSGMQDVDGGKNQKNCEIIARLIQHNFSSPSPVPQQNIPPQPEQSYTAPPQQTYSQPAFAMAPIPKKKTHGCLIALGIIAGIIVLIIVIAVVTYELGLR